MVFMALLKGCSKEQGFRNSPGVGVNTHHATGYTPYPSPVPVQFFSIT